MFITYVCAYVIAKILQLSEIYGLLKKHHFGFLMAFSLISMHCLIGNCMLKLILIFAEQICCFKIIYT